MGDPSLGQFYTDPRVGRLIANSFVCEQPQTLLELGAGQGSLLKEVQNKWKDIKIFSADIDRYNHTVLKKELPNGRHSCHDVIDKDLPNIIGVNELSIDVAVCNPPYIALSFNEKIEWILERSGFNYNDASKREFSADLVFLAQNLRFLKEGGELGIVLPDAYLSGHKYEWLRETLVRNHCISSIIDLPEKIFKGTEAKTYILMLQKGQKTAGSIKIIKASSSFAAEDELFISSEKAIQRMDYSYHRWKIDHSSSKKNEKTLSSIGADIKRGNLSKKQCVESTIPHFHTTDFKNSNSKGGVYLGGNTRRISNITKAKAGDILFARVGSRCVGKVALVRQGSIALTDCVYRIRVPKEYRELVFQALRSDEGKQWVAAHSHGVCSKVISKRDLLNFTLKLYL